MLIFLDKYSIPRIFAPSGSTYARSYFEKIFFNRSPILMHPTIPVLILSPKRNIVVRPFKTASSIIQSAPSPKFLSWIS